MYDKDIRSVSQKNINVFVLYKVDLSPTYTLPGRCTWIEGGSLGKESTELKKKKLEGHNSPCKTSTEKTGRTIPGEEGRYGSDYGRR